MGAAMRYDNLTVKAQESLVFACDVAVTRHHPQIQPEHLLIAMIEQEGGLTSRILGKLGADAEIVVTLAVAADRRHLTLARPWLNSQTICRCDRSMGCRAAR